MSTRATKTPATTQAEDAASVGLGERMLRKYRDAKAPGFDVNGKLVDRGALLEHIAKRKDAREGSSWGIEAERDQKIRKLKLANDKFEGRLIERALVAQQMQNAAGELNSFRAKSEAEHPMKFAAAAGDPAKCREVLRAVWDEIFRDLQSLHKHFKEPKTTQQ